MECCGEGSGNPLQYSCLENLMDRGAWWAAVHGVPKRRTWLSYFTFTFYFNALEKEMATHSCVLAWRIPGMGEPGGLPSIGSHRARHDWSDLAAAAAAAWSVLVISAEYVFTSRLGRLNSVSFMLIDSVGNLVRPRQGWLTPASQGLGFSWEELRGSAFTEAHWWWGRVELMAGCWLWHVCVRLGFLIVQSRWVSHIAHWDTKHVFQWKRQKLNCVL